MGLTLQMLALVVECLLHLVMGILLRVGQGVTEENQDTLAVRRHLPVCMVEEWKSSTLETSREQTITKTTTRSSRYSSGHSDHGLTGMTGTSGMTMTTTRSSRSSGDTNVF